MTVFVASAGQQTPPPRAAAFRLAGMDVHADRSGALWIASAGTLVAADLHFEKGSAFAARGMLLPPYDTAATLCALGDVITHYDPQRVIALGDSFHDQDAGSRMGADARAVLAGLMQGREWIWIAGNHDREISAGPGAPVDEYVLGPLTFRHEPRTGAQPGEIAGHLHPAAQVVSPSGRVRRKCFLSDGSRCILPAFGAYTGGLDVRAAAFDGLFPKGWTAYVPGRETVYAIDQARCG